MIIRSLGGWSEVRKHGLKGQEHINSIRKFWALVKTYADMGGYHVQFNVVDRDTLLDAQRHPENYKDLVVRLAGFSVFFVELAPQVQKEIISRTEHSW